MYLSAGGPAMTAHCSLDPVNKKSSSKSEFSVGKCYYKGQQYGQGAKWTDGCAYDCECLDAVTGRYQCYNK
jgi:hypothetical protein